MDESHRIQPEEIDKLLNVPDNRETLGARDRAIYAKQPRGVRFLVDQQNPRTCSSMVYIGPSDPWSEGRIRLERPDAGGDGIASWAEYLVQSGNVAEAEQVHWFRIRRMLTGPRSSTGRDEVQQLVAMLERAGKPDRAAVYRRWLERTKGQDPSGEAE